MVSWDLRSLPNYLTALVVAQGKGVGSHGRLPLRNLTSS